jgi:predicted N-acetyltransferase YhbS
MMSELHLGQIERTPTAYAAMARLWEAACGPAFSVTDEFMAYNLQPTPGLAQEGRFIYREWLGETPATTLESVPVGFVVASALTDAPPEIPAHRGWIDAVAVAPTVQGRGIGSALMDWAEAWLGEQGARRVDLGGSFRPFFPGLPTTLGTRPFFEQRGYTFEYETWDVARDLSVGPEVRLYPPADEGELRPAEAADVPALREFLLRTFPGRWRYEVETFLGEGGDPSDIVILELAERVEGFCWVTSEDSYRPLDRFYMHRWPHPWGQLGPIGVSGACRGQGWGGRLLQAGLVYLQEQGVRGCVIDWTSLLDFYGKFGFEPYHHYDVLFKTLDQEDEGEVSG